MANANPGNPVAAPVQVAQPAQPQQAQPQQQAMGQPAQAQAPPLIEINERFFAYMSRIAPSLNQVLNAQGVNNADLRDALDGIGDLSAQGEQQTNHIRREAKRDRRPAPMTPMPIFGNRNELPGQRDYKLEYFKGDLDAKGKRDPLQCKDWLQALGRLVTANRLTERAAINFMQLNARRAVADTIAEAIAEGCGYEEIVVQLETRFAGLRPPEQARDLCHQQRMRKEDTVEEFGARVRQLATLVTRESLRKGEELKEMSSSCFINGLIYKCRSEPKSGCVNI